MCTIFPFLQIFLRNSQLITVYNSMADKIKDNLDSIAQTGIRRTRGDMGEVEMIDVDDLIAADKYLHGKLDLTTGKAAKLRALTVQVKPPGTVGNE